MRIQTVGLTKEFGGRRAVDGLSFTVEPGKVTGFVGPNGAGKSTTLQLMLGLVRGGGRTLFDGRPYRDLPCPVREVGAVLDARSFHPRRSARDHLRMLAAVGRSPAGARRRAPDRRVEQVLDLVGLAHERRLRLHQLTTQSASLEAAFLGLTRGDVEYTAGDRP